MTAVETFNEAFFNWQQKQFMSGQTGAVMDTARRHAHQRAARERIQMVIYFAQLDVYGRTNVWFVRPHNEQPPLGAEVVMRVEYE